MRNESDESITQVMDYYLALLPKLFLLIWLRVSDMVDSRCLISKKKQIVIL